MLASKYKCEYFALYSENTTFASKEDISNTVSFLYVFVHITYCIYLVKCRGVY